MLCDRSRHICSILAMQAQLDFLKTLQPWQRTEGPAYELQVSIGSGSYGTVQVGKSSNSLGRVAVKTLPLKDKNGKWCTHRVQSAWHEIRNTQHLLAERQTQHVACDQLTDHGSHFICCVHEVFFDEASMRAFLVMELADRSLLMEIRRYQVFNDEEIRVFAVGMLRALQWLTQCQVCHNDLSPNNVLLFKPPWGNSFQWLVKLTDFGSSSTSESPRQGFVTTYNYAAPELLRFVNSTGFTDHGNPPPYTYASDIWSVGVILCQLMSDDASHNAVIGTDDPQYSKAEAFLSGVTTMLSKMNAKLNDEAEIDPTCLSNSGLALAKLMLDSAPADRITAASAMRHPYFTCPTPLTSPASYRLNRGDTILERAGTAVSRAYALLAGIRGCR